LSDVVDVRPTLCVISVVSEFVSTGLVLLKVVLTTLSVVSTSAVVKIDMTVVTKETNKYKRSLLSSPDNRVSSKVIGWIGISVLICVLLVIVLLDIGHLLRFISRFQTVFRN
jgi:hypothetical protein